MKMHKIETGLLVVLFLQVIGIILSIFPYYKLLTTEHELFEAFSGWVSLVIRITALFVNVWVFERVRYKCIELNKRHIEV